MGDESLPCGFPFCTSEGACRVQCGEFRETFTTLLWRDVRHRLAIPATCRDVTLQECDDTGAVVVSEHGVLDMPGETLPIHGDTSAAFADVDLFH